MKLETIQPDEGGGRLFERDNGRSLFEAGARPPRRCPARPDGFPSGPDFPAAPPRDGTPKVTRRQR